MSLPRQSYAQDDVPGSAPDAPGAAAQDAPSAKPSPKLPKPQQGGGGGSPDPSAAPAPGEGIKSLIDQFLSDSPRERKTETKPEEDADSGGKTKEKPEKPAKGEKAGSKGKPAPAKPKAAAPAPQPQLTPEQIASAAAEGATRALTTQKQATTVPDTFQYTEKQQRTMTVLERMAQLFPEKYKSIKAEYAARIKSLDNYAKEWEENHPGEKFDEADEQHEGWFEKNDVDWDEDDYAEALADMRAEQKVQKVAEATNQKISELDRKEKLRENAGQIVSEQVNAARAYWQQFGDEYADIVAENGQVNQAKMTELQKSGRVAFNMRIASAQDLAFETGELYKLMNGLEPFAAQPPDRNDPEFVLKNAKFQAHHALSEFAAQQEQRILSAPPEDRINEKGETFMPFSEFHKLTPDKRAGKWTFTARDLAALRANVLAAETTAAIEKREQEYRLWAEDRGVQLPEAQQNQPAVASSVPAEEAEGDDGKPESPSAAGLSKVAAAKSAAIANAPKPQTAFFSKFLS